MELGLSRCGGGRAGSLWQELPHWQLPDLGNVVAPSSPERVDVCLCSSGLHCPCSAAGSLLQAASPFHVNSLKAK